MRKKLLNLYVELANTRSKNGRHHKRAVKTLNVAYNKIDSARSSLEEVLFEDHPDDAGTDVYYGHASHERASAAFLKKKKKTKP